MSLVGGMGRERRRRRRSWGDSVRTVFAQALLMAAKDLRIFVRDRFVLGFSLVLPFAFITGFSLAFSGMGPGDEPLVLTVATQERSGISVELLGALAAENAGIRSTAHAEALAAVEQGELGGFVTFPADFTRSIVRGEPTALEVVVSGESPETEAVLAGWAQSLARGFSAPEVALGAMETLSGSEGSAAALVRELMEGDPLIGTETLTVGEAPPYNAANVTLPGILTMFVFFVAAMSASAIAQERQTRTLERLIAGGTRREAIVAGKFMGAAAVGLVQLIVLWSVGIAIFRISLGQYPGAVMLVSSLMAVASAAFGVMLASFVGEVGAATSAGVLVSVILPAIGGSWWPLFITPRWMQSLAKLTPHGWANDAFNRLMLFGAEAADVAQAMAALAGFALVFLAVAIWRFRTAPV